MNKLIEIYPLEWTHSYICDIMDTNNYDKCFRKLKNIEEVRCVCWKRIADILEKNGACIDYCDNNLC